MNSKVGAKFSREVAAAFSWNGPPASSCRKEVISLSVSKDESEMLKEIEIELNIIEYIQAIKIKKYKKNIEQAWYY